MRPSARVERAEPDDETERGESPRAGSVGGAVRQQQRRRHEQHVDGLRHKHGFAQEQHWIDGGDRRGDDADERSTHAAAEKADEHDGPGSHEAEEQPLRVDALGSEEGRHREQRREERWVLGGRPGDVQDPEVERADVAVSVGEVVREQVVRGGVAGVGQLRVDHEHEPDSHDQRSHRDRKQGDQERAVPGLRQAAGVGAGRRNDTRPLRDRAGFSTTT